MLLKAGSTNDSYPRTALNRNRLETHFDAIFASTQALREKQIQQNYRPVIGIHKWFARRPGSLFRCLLLAEFGREPISEGFWRGHEERGTVADPFMGGGTTLYEASRLGLNVIGNDINPMSAWLNERAFDPIDINAFKAEADAVMRSVGEVVGDLYKTTCLSCHNSAEVKYFLWVKRCECPHCAQTFDVFPGHLLAENVRHPNYVVGCRKCGGLNEFGHQPTEANPGACIHCQSAVTVSGNFKRGKATCSNCDFTFAFPTSNLQPPIHRLWAIEYWCEHCYPTVRGRQFKSPDACDLARAEGAKVRLDTTESRHLVPTADIPDGDETARLHRWGYSHYAQMFNQRQLLVLSSLASRISECEDVGLRRALLTVLSDILRYNNMLCRYDTYALKCQDIFSVHGFPVGLVQCENNVIGIPGVGAGGFRHFVEKYIRAKNYTERPFETLVTGKKKVLVFPEGETIAASPNKKFVVLSCQPSQDVALEPNSLDGVFTDPPYFSNVQYSELIDFCYVWLKEIIGDDHLLFANASTRSTFEASGNSTAGRGIDAFALALSNVYQRFCSALKQGAPLVFTYHHNDPVAYAPLVVAVLDCELSCTAVFPAAAEMSASTHIANTSSSILDSVFVCRKLREGVELDHRVCSNSDSDVMVQALAVDAGAMKAAGVRVSRGDLRCLLAGRIAAKAMNRLRTNWMAISSIEDKMIRATCCVQDLIAEISFNQTVDRALEAMGEIYITEKHP